VEAEKKVALCRRYAEEKKARDVVILEVKGMTDLADYFLISSGLTERHVKTISEHIEKEMKARGILPYSVEGMEQGRWVIIDYEDVVVHIFLERLREFYDLESLWYEARRVRLENRKGVLEV
jgi:ribosome-associated protein